MTWRGFLLAATCASLSTVPSTGVAGAEASDAEFTAELKALEDPTILKRRAWLDTEWNEFKDSSNDADLTFGAIWGWRLSDSQDWGVRIKVPVSFHWAGNTPGDSNEQGLGDIKLAVGTAFRHRPFLRSAVGLELRMPTASDNLGSNAWRTQLFGTVAWDVSQSVTFSPSAEYNKSIREVRGSAPQEFVEVFFPVTFLLPDRWSIAPRYEYKVDFANHDQVTRSAKVTVSKLLESRPLGFSLSLKQAIDETSKKYQVNFVTTYYFR